MPTPEPLSALTLYTTYHTADEVLILDTVDTTMAGTGTNKRIQFAILLGMAGVGTVAGGGTGLTAAGTADQLLGVAHTGGALEYKSLAAGSNVTITAAAGSITIASTNPGGTVTSVGLTMPPWLAVGGSPITGSGTLAVTAAAGQTANQVLAVTAGALAVRALAAADLPAAVVLTTGSYASPAWLTSVSGGIVTGNIGGNAASITGSITESQVTNLATDLTAKATDSAVVHLAGTETITGAKAFTSNPVSTAQGMALPGGYGCYTVGSVALGIGGLGTTPHAGSLSWGDGTGWLLDFGPTVSGSFAPKITFHDNGSATFAATNLAIHADGSIGLPSLADSAAANNSLYFSSSTNKLTYKDGSGTLHAV
jgi:hypothetical protein